jgi:hypothetical protein
LSAGGIIRAHANEGMKRAGAPDVVIAGEVIKARPQYRLVHTRRMLMSPDLAAHLGHRTGQVLTVLRARAARLLAAGERGA